ncbi:hypothetical protein BV511_06510 [Methylorubrum extorquens]|uniref:hypothetical protein n=1 Tax=Methylorubrum extorquens TaxID=408 RepID=UPI000972DC44|nr:hypothetical protein [Methylorubrum extorquens]APX84401.1 hypothetical protein BV511_06510 [Methylorubrum extorquens]
MPTCASCASSRLILTGPRLELERFWRECIRVQREDSAGLASLDFEALVPMPLEIVATIRDVSDEALQAALAATGYEDWHDWSVAHWGTEDNVHTYSGRLIGDTIFDCVFQTSWSAPEPVLEVLAARYPGLSGAVLASELLLGECLIGEIRNGAFCSVRAACDRQVDMLINAFDEPGRIGELSVHALIEAIGSPLPGRAGGASASVPMRLTDILAALTRRTSRRLARTLWFERNALDLAAQLADGASARDLRENALAQADQAAGDVVCLLTDGRMRTQLDRKIVEMVTICLCTEAMWADADLGVLPLCRPLVEHAVLTFRSEDELWAWAALAMYRPGLILDLSDADTVKQGILDYAERLHAQLAAYLSDDRREQGVGVPSLGRAAA